MSFRRLLLGGRGLRLAGLNECGQNEGGCGNKGRSGADEHGQAPSLTELVFRGRVHAGCTRTRYSTLPAPCAPRELFPPVIGDLVWATGLAPSVGIACITRSSTRSASTESSRPSTSNSAFSSSVNS